MKIVKVLLAGLVLVIAVFLAELLVTLPFGMPANPSDADMRRLLFWEYLLAAVPAGLLSLAASRLTRTASRQDALLQSLLWTGLFLLVTLAIGLGNGNLAQLLATPSLYVLLAFLFLGPLLNARLHRLA